MFRLLIVWLMIAIMAAITATLVVNHAFAAQSRYAVAKSMIGLKEGTSKANKLMGVNTRATPWCGYFVKATLRPGRKPPTNFASGAGWTSWGTPVKLSSIAKGDVVTVYSAPARSKRHVGVYSHKQGGKVCLISGNSKNTVRVGCYPASRVKAIRR